MAEPARVFMSGLDALDTSLARRFDQNLASCCRRACVCQLRRAGWPRGTDVLLALLVGVAEEARGWVHDMRNAWAEGVVSAVEL
jgi:hypothetical protein